MKTRVSLFEASRELLGPVMAHCGRVIEEGNPDLAVKIEIGGYPVEMTLRQLQTLERAFRQEYRRRERQEENKARQDTLLARMRAPREAE